MRAPNSIWTEVLQNHGPLWPLPLVWSRLQTLPAKTLLSAQVLALLSSRTKSNGTPTGDFNLEPQDKWLVKHPRSEKNARWGPANGGAYGTGTRISLKHTRAMIDAIHLARRTAPGGMKMKEHCHG